MTETKNPSEKTLSVTSSKTLTLKRGVEQGVVRQSFSHGRTKPVVVEKVKRRVIGPGEAKPEPAPHGREGACCRDSGRTGGGSRRIAEAVRRGPAHADRGGAQRARPRPR